MPACLRLLPPDLEQLHHMPFSELAFTRCGVFESVEVELLAVYCGPVRPCELCVGRSARGACGRSAVAWGMDALLPWSVGVAWCQPCGGVAASAPLRLHSGQPGTSEWTACQSLACAEAQVQSYPWSMCAEGAAQRLAADCLQRVRTALQERRLHRARVECGVEWRALCTWARWWCC